MMRPLVCLAFLSLGGCATADDRSSSDAGAGDGGAGGDGGAASTCAPPSGPGTSHGSATLTADTIWKAADGPHTITFRFTVAKGATLTIEPCAEVRLQAGQGISVEGRLIAAGTAAQPIRFLPADAAPWTCLEAWKGGSIDLSHVTLTGGGSASGANGVAVIDVHGDGVSPRLELLRVRDVAILGSDQFGVAVRGGGTFTQDSDGLIISGARSGAIRAVPLLAGTIPAGSYAGNGSDPIVLVAEDDTVLDTTLKDRGVPYRLGDGRGNGHALLVGSSRAGAARATLTLEEGVLIRVSPAGQIRMLAPGSGMPATGALIVRGTAARPVVLTSAAPAPAPGDWQGLVFDGVPDPADSLDQLRVEYAGGASQANSFHCSPGGGYSRSEDSAICLFGQPAAGFLKHSTLSASAGDGVDLAYGGGSVDFLDTNTFEGIAGCKQTLPRDLQGGCPATVPCP